MSEIVGNKNGRLVKVLFLDDMAWRHTEFAVALFVRGIEKVQLHRAWTADEAIELLNTVEFDQVFLDHDLCDDDITAVPATAGGSVLAAGEKGRERTGMDVVDHILTMQNPPQDIIIHSMNGPARAEMHRRLEESGRIARVRPIDFYTLRESLRR